MAIVPMALDPFYFDRAKNRQARFFRVLTDPRRGGETLKSISVASGLSYNSIRSYAGHNEEPHIMSLAAFYALAEAYPEYVLILNPMEGEQ